MYMHKTKRPSHLGSPGKTRQTLCLCVHTYGSLCRLLVMAWSMRSVRVFRLVIAMFKRCCTSGWLSACSALTSYGSELCKHHKHSMNIFHKNTINQQHNVRIWYPIYSTRWITDLLWPVWLSVWLIQLLYISTGSMRMLSVWSCRTSRTTGPKMSLNAFWPRAWR